MGNCSLSGKASDHPIGEAERKAKSGARSSEKNSMVSGLLCPETFYTGEDQVSKHISPHWRTSAIQTEYQQTDKPIVQSSGLFFLD